MRENYQNWLADLLYYSTLSWNIGSFEERHISNYIQFFNVSRRIGVQLSLGEICPSTDSEGARLLALQRRESRAWLQVKPSHNIGTLMENTTFKTHILTSANNIAVLVMLLSMKMVITAWAGVRVKWDYQDMLNSIKLFNVHCPPLL